MVSARAQRSFGCTKPSLTTRGATTAYRLPSVLAPRIYGLPCLHGLPSLIQTCASVSLTFSDTQLASGILPPLPRDGFASDCVLRFPVRDFPEFSKNRPRSAPGGRFARGSATRDRHSRASPRTSYPTFSVGDFGGGISEPGRTAGASSTGAGEVGNVGCRAAKPQASRGRAPALGRSRGSGSRSAL